MASALALFVALSTGGAYASHLVVDSSDVVDNSLTATDVRGKPGTSTTAAVNGSLTTDDIAGRQANAANGTTSIDGTLTQWDVKNGALVGADLANNTVGGGKVRDNSIKGADVDESSLAQVRSAVLGGFGRSGAVPSCDPDYFDTRSARAQILDVPPGARALVFGRARARIETDDRIIAAGFCALTTSSIGEIPHTTARLEAAHFQVEPPAMLVGVTPPLPAGPTSFGIMCSDAAAHQIRYEDVSASVVLISGN